MATEAKTDDDSKAKTEDATPGVVTFNVPQEAEVAISGGEILLDLPGENDFRLKVRCLLLKCFWISRTMFFSGVKI